nr:hypothetical protein [Candidatus Gracilibacteria bacterium]
MKKSIYILVAIIVLYCVSFLIVFRGVLFQEGNPLYVAKAVLIIPFADEGFSNIVEDKYLTNNSYSVERLEVFMFKKGYTFIEQMGAGYVFKDKYGNKKIVTGRMFTKHFIVYNIPN